MSTIVKTQSAETRVKPAHQRVVDGKTLLWMTMFALAATLMIVVVPSLLSTFAIVAGLAILQVFASNRSLDGSAFATTFANATGAATLGAVLYGALAVSQFLLSSWGVLGVSIAATAVFALLVIGEMMGAFLAQFILPKESFSAPVRCAAQIDSKYCGLFGKLQ